ncbi:MAG: Bro-N domain-containing protein [Christensenellales bacterium]
MQKAQKLRSLVEFQRMANQKKTLVLSNHMKPRFEGKHMNNLEIFQTPEFGTVRTVIREDAPWFVAADVCRILGLDQVSRAMDRLDDDEKGSVKVPHPQSPDKTLEMNGVNEPGLYHLVLCSPKRSEAFAGSRTNPGYRRNGYILRRNHDG